MDNFQLFDLFVLDSFSLLLESIKLVDFVLGDFLLCCLLRHYSCEDRNDWRLVSQAERSLSAVLLPFVISGGL